MQENTKKNRPEERFLRFINEKGTQEGPFRLAARMLGIVGVAAYLPQLLSAFLGTIGSHLRYHLGNGGKAGLSGDLVWGWQSCSDRTALDKGFAVDGFEVIRRFAVEFAM
jgi:hypothetical protein